jgi:hypothetical protein
MVFSGNVIHADEMQDIKDRIDFLNSLTPAELTLHYQKQLKEGTITSDGSAGLGWIDIARKANRPLQYKFVELNSGDLFFEITIFISVEE